jgi:hypothetical protein
MKQQPTGRKIRPISDYIRSTKLTGLDRLNLRSTLHHMESKSIHIESHE